MSEAPVADLLTRAAEGDTAAWNQLVDRYCRLVWSVVRGFRLGDAASHDVAQTVWLRLVENCHRIRDPERLPGWLATTARNEALRILNQRRRQVPTEFGGELADPTRPGLDERLIEDETSRQALRAFGELSEGCQQLLRLLCADPPLDYETISDMIDRPIGSIGPTRQRCLDKLRAQMAELERPSP